ncbi:hypothetical protein BGZ94_004971 [Podila epigama]|nr:hypothetical protein BGZ94_004971 [Podila epigama]
MIPSTVRLAAVVRTPLIKFLGPRSALNQDLKDRTPKSSNRVYYQTHHEATRHPAAPKDAEYPLKTGPIGKVAATSSSSSSSVTSSSPSSSAVKTPGPHGASRTFLDFAQLPNRYRHPELTEAEIEAVEAGGATLIY